MKICPSCQNRYEADTNFCPEDGTELVEPDDTPSGSWSGDHIDEVVQVQDLQLTGHDAETYTGVLTESERDVSVTIFEASTLDPGRHAEALERAHEVLTDRLPSGILALHSVDLSLGEAPYTIEERAEGTSLADLLERERVLNWEHAARLVTRVARLLQWMADRDVLHFALNPHDIFIDEDDEQVQIGHWYPSILSHRSNPLEIARNVETYHGPAPYLSPEAIRADEHVDLRSSIYTMGMLLYEMLLGKPPFTSKKPEETLERHLDETPLKLSLAAGGRDIPGDLDEWLTHTWSKDPDERFASPQAAGRALAELLETSFESVAPPLERREQPCFEVDASDSPELEQDTSSESEIPDDGDSEPDASSSHDTTTSDSCESNKAADAAADAPSREDENPNDEVEETSDDETNAPQQAETSDSSDAGTSDEPSDTRDSELSGETIVPETEESASDSSDSDESSESNGDVVQNAEDDDPGADDTTSEADSGVATGETTVEDETDEDTAEDATNEEVSDDSTQPSDAMEVGNDGGEFTDDKGVQAREVVVVEGDEASSSRPNETLFPVSVGSIASPDPETPLKDDKDKPFETWPRGIEAPVSSLPRDVSLSPPGYFEPDADSGASDAPALEMASLDAFVPDRDERDQRDHENASGDVVELDKNDKAEDVVELSDEDEADDSSDKADGSDEDESDEVVELSDEDEADDFGEDEADDSGDRDDASDEVVELSDEDEADDSSDKADGSGEDESDEVVELGDKDDASDEVVESSNEDDDSGEDEPDEAVELADEDETDDASEGDSDEVVELGTGEEGEKETGPDQEEGDDAEVNIGFVEASGDSAGEGGEEEMEGDWFETSDEEAWREANAREELDRSEFWRRIFTWGLIVILVASSLGFIVWINFLAGGDQEPSKENSQRDRPTSNEAGQSLAALKRNE